MTGNPETAESATNDVADELEVLHEPLASLVAKLAAIARYYDVCVTLTVGASRGDGDDDAHGGELTS